MSLNPENLNDILPEQAIATAVAIAERSAQAEALNERVAAEILGVPYVEAPAEVRRAAHLGRSTLMLAQLENPGKTLTLQALIEANSNSGYAYYAYKAEVLSAQHNVPVDTGTVKGLEAAAIKELQAEPSASDDRINENFARQLTASKRVAEAHNVELATVYTDDDLYYEASREAYTPEEAVEQTQSLLNALSTGMMNKITLQTLDRILPQDLRDEMTQDDLAALGLELQLNPALQAIIAAQTSSVQEITRQTFLYTFVKTYGYDAINRLSDEQRENLLPKMPLATDLIALMYSSSEE